MLMICCQISINMIEILHFTSPFLIIRYVNHRVNYWDNFFVSLCFCHYAFTSLYIKCIQKATWNKINMACTYLSRKWFSSAVILGLIKIFSGLVLFEEVACIHDYSCYYIHAILVSLAIIISRYITAQISHIIL